MARKRSSDSLEPREGLHEDVQPEEPPASVLTLHRGRKPSTDSVTSMPTLELPPLLSADTLAKFKDKLENARSQHKAIALLCHDHPDPDSFGPAFALKVYLESIGIDAEIFHGGEVSHPENRAAQNVLAIEMSDSEQLVSRSKEFSSTILMDAAATGGMNVRSTNIRPDVVIDHHDEENTPPKALVIRRRVGSVCTIVTHLLRALGFHFEDYPRAATALYLGLQTDTDGLMSDLVTPYDLAAHSLLIQAYDQKSYRRILRYVLPESLLRLKALAYGPYYFRQGPLVVTGVGFLDIAGKDMLAIIADEIVRVEGITKVVVMGVMNSEHPALVASIRTSVDTLNTHDFVQEIFGESHAGAKQGAGGAYVQFGAELAEIIRQAIRNGEGDSVFRSIFGIYRDKVTKHPG